MQKMTEKETLDIVVAMMEIEMQATATYQREMAARAGHVSESLLKRIGFLFREQRAIAGVTEPRD